MATPQPIAASVAGATKTRATTMARRSRVATVAILSLLSLVAFLGSYDRFLTSIVTQAIKAEMHVTDSQIGLMSGLVFAAVYSLLAVPIARYSDRGQRVNVLSISIAFWSIMTALCGLAPNIVVLLLARLGVGAGEAGGNPTIHALVSETVDQRWRGTALAAVTVVGGLGFMAASLLGGTIVDQWGWRAAFFVGAIPGPVLALLVWLTVKEPAIQVAVRRESMLEAARVLLRRRAFFLMCLGVGVCSIASFAVLAWAPAYLMRHFHVSAGVVGKGYGVATGAATIAAMLLGGIVGDVLARRDQRWNLWFPALSFLLCAPFTVAFLLVDDLPAALMLAAPMTFFAALPTSPCYALVQALAGNRYRATASALFMLFMYLVGMGLGPALAGALSDVLARGYGDDGLRFSLVMLSLAYLAGSLILTRGTKTLAKDLGLADIDRDQIIQ